MLFSRVLLRHQRYLHRSGLIASLSIIGPTHHLTSSGLHIAERKTLLHHRFHRCSHNSNSNSNSSGTEYHQDHHQSENVKVDDDDDGSSSRFERDLKILVGETFAADERVRRLARNVQTAYDAFLEMDYMRSRRIYDETTVALEQILLGETAAAAGSSPQPSLSSSSSSPQQQQQQQQHNDDEQQQQVSRRKSFPLLAFCYNNLAEAMKSLAKYVDLSFMNGEVDVDPSDGYRFRYALSEMVLLYDRALDVWGYDRARMEGSAGRGVKDGSGSSKEGDGGEHEGWSEEEREQFYKIFMREMGALYNNIGLYHMEETNMLDDAMQWFQRAEEKRRELIEHYPDENQFKTQLGITMNNIAQCFSRTRKHQRAMSAYQRAGEIFREAVEKSIDNYSPVHIVVLNNIGLGHFNRKETPMAIQCFNTALDLIEKREKATGKPAGEELGITLSNIATVDLHRKMYAQAESFYRQALANFRSNLNPNHPSIAECCSQLTTAIFQRRRQKQGGEPVDPEAEAAENQELQDLAQEAKRIAEFHKQRREALKNALKRSTTTKEGQQKATTQQAPKPKSMFSRMFGKK